MKLSIITINFNNSFDLAKTIKSVVEQEWQDFEYLIVDGGSSDKSVEVIREYQSNIAYWVSEPDNGIYNAMNKGVIKAQGEYLLMLNSGDVLCDSKALTRVFAHSCKEDIIAADVYRAMNGSVFEESHFPDYVTFGYFITGMLSHQATFIKRTAHDIVGLYDEQLKYVSDWKFLVLAICRHNLTYKHIPCFVATCDCSGLTCIPANFMAMEAERRATLKQYFPAFLADYDEFEFMRSKAFKQRFSKAFSNTKSYLKKILQIGS
ncbi:MAG: glycosyltransferase [Hymenobacter sp.]|nr:MAG: glycosyltransferase [Hymenobacter sp.]